MPLMLHNIQPSEIKDADLRMFLEGHTYLDCTNKVQTFFFFLFNVVQLWYIYLTKRSYFWIFQEFLEKRLRDAMPKVTLKEWRKAQEGGVNSENNEKGPTTRVEKVAQLIGHARQARSNFTPKEDIHVEVIGANEREQESVNWFEPSNMERNCTIDDSAENEDNEGMNNHNDNDLKTTKGLKVVRFLQSFDLEKKEIQLLSEMESRIQKTYPGKSLRVVLIQSDSDNDTMEISGSDSSNRNKPENNGPEIVNGTSIQFRLSGYGTFNAENFGNHAGDRERQELVSPSVGQLEGAVGGVEAKSFPKFYVNVAFEQEGGNSFVAHSDSVNSESSESEGGWDFETGGMPLLPR